MLLMILNFKENFILYVYMYVQTIDIGTYIIGRRENLLLPAYDSLSEMHLTSMIGSVPCLIIFHLLITKLAICFTTDIYQKLCRLFILATGLLRHNCGTVTVICLEYDWRISIYQQGLVSYAHFYVLAWSKPLRQESRFLFAETPGIIALHIAAYVFFFNVF